MGYKQPPKQYQFKKRHSGNPLGRPRVLKRSVIEIVEYLFTLTIRQQKISRTISRRILHIHRILKYLVEKEEK